jgi:hypothetical protein
MSHPVGWFDRLRIERLVWSLDQQLYDLPRATRIATRRDVRANLLLAAADLGIGPALRRVGSSRRLAEQYLSAEYGDRPRHSWVAAAYVAGLVPLVLNFVLGEAATAFRDGVAAADPHANGTFVWSGLSLLQSPAAMTFTDGRSESVGGAWTPLTYALWLVAAIAAGRLWRLLPSRDRRVPTSA